MSIEVWGWVGRTWFEPSEGAQFSTFALVSRPRASGGKKGQGSGFEGRGKEKVLTLFLFSLVSTGVASCERAALAAGEFGGFFWTTCTWFHNQRGLAVFTLSSKRNFSPRWDGAKTKVWNMAGVRPVSCDVLERIVRNENRWPVVWRGSGLDTREQGIKILGIRVGIHVFKPWRNTLWSASHLSRVPETPSPSLC